MCHLTIFEVMPVAVAHMLLMHPLHDIEDVSMARQLGSFYAPSQLKVEEGCCQSTVQLRSYHAPLQTLCYSVQSVPKTTQPC